MKKKLQTVNIKYAYDIINDVNYIPHKIHGKFSLEALLYGPYIRVVCTGFNLNQLYLMDLSCNKSTILRMATTYSGKKISNIGENLCRQLHRRKNSHMQ